MYNIMVLCTQTYDKHSLPRDNTEGMFCRPFATSSPAYIELPRVPPRYMSISARDGDAEMGVRLQRLRDQGARSRGYAEFALDVSVLGRSAGVLLEYE